TWGRFREDLKSVKRNYCRQGLALDSRLSRAFLEQELNANAMLYGGSKIPHAVVNDKNFRLYARRRFPDWSGDLSDDAPVFPLTTRGLFCDGTNPPLALLPSGRHAGRRDIETLDEACVRGLIGRASSYLATQVQNSGRFNYGWHPCFDRPIRAYNS